MSAILDDTRTYRYRLERVGAMGGRTCLFVMLNPSTADETQDDPTIRRCKGFAAREGCDRLVVVNLYAFRSPHPSSLKETGDPIGPDNEAHIRAAAQEADLIICAWGGNHLGGSWPHRVLRILGEHGDPMALRLTKNGDPGHPLYVPADAPLIPVAGWQTERGAE